MERSALLQDPKASFEKTADEPACSPPIAARRVIPDSRDRERIAMPDSRDV